MNKVKEIEQELQEFADELKRISENKLKKSDLEYNHWVHNYFFEADIGSMNAIEKSNIECILKLKQAVNCLTNKPENEVKVVLTVMHEWTPREVWVEKILFEKMRENDELVLCPNCNSWVLKIDSYDCTCGYHFKDRNEVIEITRPDGVIERHIKKSPHSCEHEIVVEGKTYPAEYRLVPKEEEK